MHALFPGLFACVKTSIFRFLCVSVLVLFDFNALKGKDCIPYVDFFLSFLFE